MSTARHTPIRVEGWKFAGRAGGYHVWHAGKNDYRITDGAQGEVIATKTQFGEAHSAARRHDSIRQDANITSYYSENRRAKATRIAP